MASILKVRNFGLQSLVLARTYGTKPISAVTSHKKLISWIEEKQKHLKPDNVRIVSGSDEEYDELVKLLINNGSMEALNPQKRPNSFLALTNPADVARTESNTFICSEKEEDSGPTNNWVAPAQMRAKMDKLFDGCMQGRTMYVIPFSMGPVGSPLSKIGVEITDSPFVVLNMKLMTRSGKNVLEALGSNGEFVPALHSLGAPLKPGQKDVPWPCNIQNRHIAHFPETREIVSFGSGYGGNSLLGKKCFALRIASVQGRDEGWMAEHMLILGLTNPQGKKYYVAAAFPSACGKTNLAMLTPTLPGWKVECVGDDIAWMRFGADGKLYAINPENGFFGVAPGTSAKTNPNALASISKNTIFTNVAKTEDGDVWWEGLSKEPPKGKIINWKGQVWNPASKEPAAHPNSRFTVAAKQCPSISPMFEDPKGVPIDAIIFGGRRPETIPLVYEAFSWQHGTFIGASVASETTHAAEQKAGEIRFDPMAMLPFCGYHMGDYFNHWLNIGKKQAKTPKVFHVNWFRQEKGKFLWPGFGDNSRVLKWITERIEEKDVAQKTAIGYVPKQGTLDLNGLDIDAATVDKLLKVEPAKWMNQIPAIENYFSKFGSKLPAGLTEELNGLKKRLSEAK